MSSLETSVVRALERLGVEQLFAVPGAQNVGLFSELARSRIHTTVTTHELSAGFAALGYARASGRVGVLTTIPGPGFAYALPALAEALLDATPLVILTGAPAVGPGGVPGHQAIEQRATADPLVKGYGVIGRSKDAVSVLDGAFKLAAAFPEGPVLVELSSRLRTIVPDAPDLPTESSPEALAQVAQALSRARTPLLLVGPGSIGAEAELRRLAEFLSAPVLATPRARGVIPEDHPLCLTFDNPGASAKMVNGILAEADCILALGCHPSHNEMYGFALQFPPGRLLHVSPTPQPFAEVFGATLAVRAGIAGALESLTQSIARVGKSGWAPAQLLSLRSRFASAGSLLPEPRLVGLTDRDSRSLPEAIRRTLPPDGVVITDSGRHQYLIRRYFQVLRPRTLVTPSEFQSMGFGIPAAIGASLARGRGFVVAVVGDGGLAVSGLELATAAVEQLPLTVVVLADRRLGLIRLQQLRSTGTAFATEAPPLDLRSLASACGVRYLRAQGSLDDVLHEASKGRAPTLLEIRAVEDERAARFLSARGRALRGLRHVVGSSVVDRLIEWRREARR